MARTHHESKVIFEFVSGNDAVRKHIIGLIDGEAFRIYTRTFEAAKKLFLDQGHLTEDQCLVLMAKLDLGETKSLSESIDFIRNRNFSEALEGLASKLSLAAKEFQVNPDTNFIKAEIEKFSEEMYGQRLKSVRTAGDFIDNVIKKGDKRHRGESNGVVPWYYGKFQHIALEPGTYCVIAARPAVGKTAFGLNVALRMALSGVRVGFICIEMDNEQITQRLMCIHSGVSYETLSNGELNPKEQFVQYYYSFEQLRDKHLMLDCGEQYDMNDVDGIINQWRLQKDVQVVFIDYLQRLTHQQSRDERRSRVGKTSYDIKICARRHRIPIVTFAQLNREAQGNRPTMAQLRETGDIEQDADVVVLMDRDLSEPREKTYMLNTEAGPKEIDLTKECMFLTEKNRNGECAMRTLPYDMRKLKFYD